jgi:hypothetical protein
VKNTADIKSFLPQLCILGLTLLLLLAPCKTRNLIQSTLGVQQTETVNKSKTTVNPASCGLFFEQEIILSNTGPSKPFHGQALPNVDFSVFKTRPSNGLTFGFENRNHHSPTIPYYILYQNFKVYL